MVPFHVPEVNAEGRAAGAQLIREAKAAGGKTKVFLYVNNRFEGNAPETLAAMVKQSEWLG